jgi:hypothetical protein
MSLLNYTTSIDVTKTMGQVHGILVKAGARKIVVDYDEQGNPTGLNFIIVFFLIWTRNPGEEKNEIDARVDCLPHYPGEEDDMITIEW